MNGYWGARVLLLSKRGAGKGWSWCVCVCVCVCGSVGGCEGLGGYHIQRLTNLLFSQDLYKKKIERRLAVDNSVLCFNILDEILLLFLFERFRLNVDVALFDKVKQNYLTTS